jgi:hypothetical protein
MSSINIALFIEFNNKISILSIKCKKCLDTKLMWKQRSDNDDNLGWFIILNCDLCSDSLFVQYSNTNNLLLNGIPIFNIHYTEYQTDIYSYSIRIPIIRKLYSLYELLQRKKLYENI